MFIFFGSSGDDEEDPDAWVPDPIDADPQFFG